MLKNEHLEQLADCIKTQPFNTQLSIGLNWNDKPSFYGIINKNGNIQQIDNKNILFEIGSVTKALTGNILAQLVVVQKIKLDELIQNLLPFSLKGNPPITLKHLAFHTSGLPRMPSNFESQPAYDKRNPYKNYGEHELINYLKQDLILEAFPNQKFQYSNLGYGLLSYMISKIENKPFADIVKARIFKPLEMINSVYHTPEINSDIVKGVDEYYNICNIWEGGILNGCVGIVSTTNDLMNFAEMTCSQADAASNLQARETFIVTPDFKSNLGWGERLVEPENIIIQGINGGTGGSAASVMVNRQHNYALVILSNLQPNVYMDNIYPLAKSIFAEALQTTTKRNAAISNSPNP
jgi:CubicO group peptidase (beta-lactamase class C family)